MDCPEVVDWLPVTALVESEVVAVELVEPEVVVEVFDSFAVSVWIKPLIAVEINVQGRLLSRQAASRSGEDSPVTYRPPHTAGVRQIRQDNWNLTAGVLIRMNRNSCPGAAGLLPPPPGFHEVG